MKKRVVNIIGIAAIVSGLILFLYPDLKAWYLDRQTAKLVSGFENQVAPAEKENVPDGDMEVDANNSTAKETGTLPSSEALWDTVCEYNNIIYEEGQSGFKDAWSVTQAPDALEGVYDDMFGYIEIPAMDITLPLYLGASEKHMSKGAAILGETSIPVGGINTNSVIAGHRGWKSGPYFREIEKLSVGDAVYITNPWDTLAYRVESIDIINPDDSDKVKIQEGKDMVTLLTCHPYRSHGKYRYVVYCVRDDSTATTAVAQEQETQKEHEGYIVASDGNVYASSQDDLHTENTLRKAGAAVILLIVCCTFISQLKKKR